MMQYGSAVPRYHRAVLRRECGVPGADRHAGWYAARGGEGSTLRAPYAMSGTYVAVFCTDAVGPAPYSVLPTSCPVLTRRMRHYQDYKTSYSYFYEAFEAFQTQVLPIP
eukprot:1832678-Rhodomonas_salina.3